MLDIIPDNQHVSVFFIGEIIESCPISDLQQTDHKIWNNMSKETNIFGFSGFSDSVLKTDNNATKKLECIW